MSLVQLPYVEDRLEAIERNTLRLLEDRPAQLWLSKLELAQALGMSVRWVEDRMAEGKALGDPVPHRVYGKSVRFNLGRVETWLARHGCMKEIA